RTASPRDPGGPAAVRGPTAAGPMIHGLVSVVVPVYNGERHVAEALESIRTQSHGAIEVLVVDDGSTDGTPSVVERAGVAYVRQERSGPAAAVNRGIALARGSLIGFLDADDRWRPDKLTLQMRAFAADSTLDAVFGHIEHFHSPELDEQA